jgi:hypothetical protein
VRADPGPDTPWQLNRDASLAKLFRDFAQRWEIEKIARGPEWIAIDRDTGGDYIRLIAAHDLHALRYRLAQAEREEPEKREPDARS